MDLCDIYRKSQAIKNDHNQILELVKSLEALLPRVRTYMQEHLYGYQYPHL